MKNWNWGGISVAIGLAALAVEFPWLLIPATVCVAWGCGVFNRKVQK